MFDGILKEYEKSKKTVEKENELLRKEIKSISEPLTRKLINGVNSDVQVLNSNQKMIEKEVKDLKQEVTKFYKEISSWQGLYDDLNGALKELGDVVNWSNCIEKDFLDIVQKMEAIKLTKLEEQQKQTLLKANLQKLQTKSDSQQNVQSHINSINTLNKSTILNADNLIKDNSS